MNVRSFRARRLVPIALLATLAVACVVVSTNTRPTSIDASALRAVQVGTPFRAHLLDGSVIVFDYGASVGPLRVDGTGRRFNALRTDATASAGVPLDSVLGFEVYRRTVNPARTLVYAPATAFVSAVGLAALAVVLFGSCPTIYADSAGVQTLQAESFSYSIAPLLGKRDVDRMTVTPDANGVIRLAVRNEALETHHLDHMEIVEVRHGANEIAVPSPRGGALTVSSASTPATIRDGAGRDVFRSVARADEIAFSTDDGLLDRAIAGGSTNDQLVVTVPRRGNADSVALVLKARSSLLTTSVLYEHLMGRQGALALDWMGSDLTRISALAGLGQWYGANFGMRVEVQEGNEWHHVIRLMDFGPTAWRTVGVAIPALRSTDDSIRIRLTFAADAFRIDQLVVAENMRRVDQRRIPIARAVDSDGKARADIVTMLSKADDRDVETSPGQQFWIEFDTKRSRSAVTASDSIATYFFAAQGYYTEWLRPSWMKNGKAREAFAPNASTMRELLQSWKGGRDSLETLFFRRRVPVA